MTVPKNKHGNREFTKENPPSALDFAILDNQFSFQYAVDLYTAVFDAKYNYVSELLWKEFIINEKTQKQVAAMLDWSGSNVHLKLRHWNYPLRPEYRSKFSNPKDIADIRSYEGKLGHRKVAKMFSCAESVVIRIWKRQFPYDYEVPINPN